MKLPFALWLLPAVSLAANPVVKSVDADGTVTYGDRPSSGAVQAEMVEVPQGPSAEAQAQAQAVEQAIKERGDELASDRLAREQAAAEARKKAAEAAAAKKAAEAEETERVDSVPIRTINRPPVHLPVVPTPRQLPAN